MDLTPVSVVCQTPIKCSCLCCCFCRWEKGQKPIPFQSCLVVGWCPCWSGSIPGNDQKTWFSAAICSLFSNQFHPGIYFKWSSRQPRSIHSDQTFKTSWYLHPRFEPFANWASLHQEGNWAQAVLNCKLEFLLSEFSVSIHLQDLHGPMLDCPLHLLFLANFNVPRLGKMKSHASAGLAPFLALF